ncbi:MAG: cytidylate kinase-like family protein [Clostridiales bacterium]|nr:cytidylate kinase-like family protein [Clostridiales bacterium]
MAIRILTISRQFGSGGRSIAKDIANRLGWDYYDKDIIDEISLETGFSKEFVASKSEEAPGKTVFSYGFESHGIPGIMNGMSTHDYLWTVQRKIVRQIAEKGKPCVIVGRNADYILKDFEGVLNVFIHADMEFRINRVLRKYGQSEVKIEKRLNDKDKKRAVNHKHFTDLQWGFAPNYDLTLNSSKLGHDKCVEILENVIKGSENEVNKD